jgi:hypothetical protein
MQYLGQSIELIEEAPGWLGVWFHPCCVVQLGFFPTALSAWEAVTELVRRDGASRSLAGLTQEWREQNLISASEQDAIESSLFQYVFDETAEL